jgi:UDP-N-acetylglucosamine 2-epimerase (non-hydrolysing)
MIAFVYGTRPEAIKISPVVEELRLLRARPRIICTGQHTDLLSGTPADTVLRDGVNLKIPSQNSVKDFLAVAIPRLRAYLAGAEPRVVVVQGDTMSALAGARAAQALRIPVAHIEAGVRSWADEPWPEECIRREITRVATRHYAATGRAMDHLALEGVAPCRVVLSGNPGISALYQYTDARPRDAVGHTIVITLHRRELRIKGLVPGLLAQLQRAVRAAPQYTFLWPVHPAIRQDSTFPHPDHMPRNLTVLGPVPYRVMTDFVAGASGVLTDSGGLVEEAATLGVPTAILRHHNDRHEAVEAGIAKRFDPEEVEAAVAWLVGGTTARTPTDVYGTATSAGRIAADLRYHYPEIDS